MKYFAYGSNMSIARLKARTPSAKRIGTFILTGHELRFHKLGRDGSGKCDAYQTDEPQSQIFGALFEIDENEKLNLDLAESLGVGYGEKVVKVVSATGEEHEAITYYALNISASLKPYSWYLNHVIIGAMESQLPTPYLKFIQTTESIEDEDLLRDKLERGVY
ncbi:gamma-glutamylcyclotransferase family protein [Shewanella nanhaiensis]|uniref:Gamma-glutamylcyclotransferase n=1 Tax=Shewanella nanhaiensis TaxID=2864872 RepID=A0ABS7DYT3_9GAMM|nr:gamma-glutamylcyclotransferase family protein [Shewanella nanhaiensis]MBW8182509.1 gamma-glutamylcyclotransferase [Shewanella nanhaiensis]